MMSRDCIVLLSQWLKNDSEFIALLRESIDQMSDQNRSLKEMLENRLKTELNV